MRRIIFICIVFLVAALFAQDDADEQRFSFNADINRFRYSDSLSFVEYTASLVRNQLEYVQDGDVFKGEFITTSELMVGDSIVMSKKWKNVNAVDSLGTISDYQRLYCINNFITTPGEYKLRLKIEDAHSEKFASAVIDVTIKDFFPGEIKLSDIQLASLIKRDTTNSVFTKNGYQILPNTTALYGIGLPILYNYSEIYNLLPGTSEEGGKYRVQYTIMDADNKIAKEQKPKIRKKPGSSAVEVNSINVVTLVSGPYILKQEVTDLENNQSVSIQEKFFVYREADYAEGGLVYQKKEEMQGLGSPGVDAARYNTMSEKELDQEFDYARYISTREERKTFRKLNLEGKRKYIQEFWASRDETLGTAENEFKFDYLQRVAFSNQLYKGGFRDGWKTDRGRVLLVYGRPDDIERYPFSNDNKAYEVWQYYAIEGGVIFVFVDKRDLGDLELVHSTVRGEIFDNEWERWINPNQ